ncbi:hypothetical protein [Okeania sp. SIO3B5]|nr:hypothetical protein [Okeania sp. SIO3B5]
MRQSLFENTDYQGRQKAEGRRQRAEGRRQKAEGRRFFPLSP